MDLSVCIVLHESRAYLDKCLDSVYASEGSIESEVIVIDNCSHDGSAERVRSRYPQASLSVNSERHGFATNMNRAFRLSRGRYLLALNPDTIVEPQTLEKLVGFLDNTPAAAAAGCKTLYPDGSLQMTCREFPSIATVVWRWLHLERLYRPGFYRRFMMSDWAHDQACPVDWVMGSSLLLRRQIAFDIGLFDEGYYLYYEDIDLCFRLKQRGLAVYYVPEARIIHEYQRHSARGLFNQTTAWHVHSVFRYFSKHGWRVI